MLHHLNSDKNQQCFVRLFKLYQDKCVTDAPPHAFYLMPTMTHTSQCWCSKCPLGHNPLSGIAGYKTNHSLRATATTHLYQCGVDEQMVMELTGHRSLEGV